MAFYIYFSFVAIFYFGIFGNDGHYLSSDTTYDDYIFFYNFSYNNMSRVDVARSRAQSYSSGGGGFSSGGGGGGSFGGGGGGGGFR